MRGGMLESSHSTRCKRRACGLAARGNRRGFSAPLSRPCHRCVSPAAPDAIRTVRSITRSREAADSSALRSLRYSETTSSIGDSVVLRLARRRTGNIGRAIQFPPRILRFPQATVSFCLITQSALQLVLLLWRQIVRGIIAAKCRARHVSLPSSEHSGYHRLGHSRRATRGQLRPTAETAQCGILWCLSRWPLNSGWSAPISLGSRRCQSAMELRSLSGHRGAPRTGAVRLECPVFRPSAARGIR